MLSPKKLSDLSQQRQMGVGQLAKHLVRGGMELADASSALRNWQRGLFKPAPTAEDLQRLASALGVEVHELKDWHCAYRYAPLSASKARLVTRLIVGRSVQDAMDLLKFTRRRAAPMVSKLLKCATADADEQQADVDTLVVKEARVDDAGVRMGTKRFRAKDRGRAHAIRQKACHIHVIVTQG
jgi:large subunit ribosomal protein L22